DDRTLRLESPTAAPAFPHRSPLPRPQPETPLAVHDASKSRSPTYLQVAAFSALEGSSPYSLSRRLPLRALIWQTPADPARSYRTPRRYRSSPAEGRTHWPRSIPLRFPVQPVDPC